MINWLIENDAIIIMDIIMIPTMVVLSLIVIHPSDYIYDKKLLLRTEILWSLVYFIISLYGYSYIAILVSWTSITLSCVGALWKAFPKGKYYG